MPKSSRESSKSRSKSQATSRKKRYSSESSDSEDKYRRRYREKSSKSSRSHRDRDRDYKDKDKRRKRYSSSSSSSSSTSSSSSSSSSSSRTNSSRNSKKLKDPERRASNDDSQNKYLFDFKDSLDNEETNLRRINDIEADSFRQENFVSSAAKKLEVVEESPPDVSDTFIHPKVSLIILLKGQRSIYLKIIPGQIQIQIFISRKFHP